MSPTFSPSVSVSLSLPHARTEAQTSILSSWPFLAVGWESGGMGPVTTEIQGIGIECELLVRLVVLF